MGESNARNNFMSRYIGDLPAARLAESLDNGDGLVTFTCSDADTLLASADEMGQIMSHRDSDARGITTIRDTPGRDPEQDVGLTRAALPLHTDRPATKEPPSTIILWCQEAASEGGDALLARGDAVVAYLEQNDPAALNTACGSEAAIFCTGDDVWRGPVFAISDGVVTEVRLRMDPHVYFQTALARALPRIDEALKAVTLPLELRRGEGYAVLNRLWLHGRREYGGEREFLRIMMT